jgi:hypothetical protein
VENQTKPLKGALNGTTARLAYSISGFAEAADTSKSVVYQAIRDGKLKARRHGGRTIILDHDGRDYLEALPIATPENVSRGIKRSDRITPREGP